MLLKGQLAFVCLLVFCLISVFPSSKATVLQLGKPVNGSVLATHYSSFVVEDVTSDTNALFVGLTSYCGEAQVFMDFDHIPTREHHRWRANNNQVIHLKNHDLDSHGKLMISVYGLTSGHFGLLAYDNKHPTTLTDHTVTAFVPAHMYTFFEYQLPDDKSFTVSATVLKGNLQIFVSTKTQTPTKDNHEWATRADGSNMIIIRSSDMSFQPHGKYYISVLGEGSPALFSISTTAATVPEIVSAGVPVSGFVQEGGFRYFDFLLERNVSARIKAMLLPERWANVGFYGTEGDVGLPTRDQYYWVSEGMGNHVLVVDPSDPHFVSPGVYHFGVFAYMDTIFQFVVEHQTKN